VLPTYYAYAFFVKGGHQKDVADIHAHILCFSLDGVKQEEVMYIQKQSSNAHLLLFFLRGEHLEESD
jgi:hypothetical protein